MRAVWLFFGARAIASGDPWATMWPPSAPPSGPRSMIQSASAMMSRLCSMTTTLLPASTSRCSTLTSFSTSAMCSPTVGSSSTYSVCMRPRRASSMPSWSVRTLASSATSLILWLSPPESVGLGCPRLKYPRPTSVSMSSGCRTRGWAAKNSTASSTLIARVSPMLRSLNRMDRVSWLKRRPPQTSHSTCTSGRKLISMRCIPCPSQASQRPPAVLNENRPAVKPRMRASAVSAYRRRIASQKPM